MNHITRRAFGAAGFALLLVTSASFAQQPPPVRVRGTVEAVDGPVLTVKSRDGQTTWGYSRCATAEEFAVRYAELLRVVRQLQVLSGFCYTQFADTYQEANGLLYADRTPKIPMHQIEAATRGRDSVSTDGIAQLLPIDDQ